MFRYKSATHFMFATKPYLTTLFCNHWTTVQAETKSDKKSFAAKRNTEVRSQRECFFQNMPYQGRHQLKLNQKTFYRNWRKTFKSPMVRYKTKNQTTAINTRLVSSRQSLINKRQFNSWGIKTNKQIKVCFSRFTINICEWRQKAIPRRECLQSLNQSFNRKPTKSRQKIVRQKA